MTLQKLVSDVKAFAEWKSNKMEEYDQFASDLKNNHLWSQEGKDEALKRFLDEAGVFAFEEVKKIFDLADKVKSEELDRLQTEDTGVTSDDVAELSLLEKMDLTADELNHYFKKYKFKPLAIKKLRQIANSRMLDEPDLVTFEYYDIKAHLDNFITEIKSEARYINDNLTWGESQAERIYTVSYLSSMKKRLDDMLRTYLNEGS